MDTPRPRRELPVEWLSSLGVVVVFIDKLSGASPLLSVVVAAVAAAGDVEELGFPIRELTSKARGFPLTVWLLTLELLLFVVLLLTFPGRRSSWMDGSALLLECRS